MNQISIDFPEINFMNLMLTAALLLANQAPTRGKDFRSHALYESHFGLFYRLLLNLCYICVTKGRIFKSPSLYKIAD